jgi:hypothetical protein
MATAHHLPLRPRHPLILLATATVVVVAFREVRAFVSGPPFSAPV